jgi:hypothetical protein
MTYFLDIAVLAALLIALTFVPLHGIRADRKITRQIREAEQSRTAHPTHSVHPTRPTRRLNAHPAK